MVDSRSRVDEKTRGLHGGTVGTIRTLRTWMILSPPYRILRMMAMLDTRIILSLCLFSSRMAPSASSKYRNSLSLAYRKLERLASAKELIRIPLLVQTRAQRGKLPPAAKASAKRERSPNLERKEKQSRRRQYEAASGSSLFLDRQAAFWANIYPRGTRMVKATCR